MKRGSFTIEGSTNIMRGQANSKWQGISSDSTYIYIEGTRILDVKRRHIDTLNYALDIHNPTSFYFYNSSITPISSTDSSNNGLLVIYSSGVPFTPNLQIQNDSILVNATGGYGVNIDSYSNISGTFNISNNYLKHLAGGGAAILLVGLEDALLYANTIREWSYSVYAYSSSIRLWANYINSTISDHQLWGESYSVFDLSSNAGGNNTILTNTGRCIKVDASYFDTHSGGNYFVKQDTSVSYFFDGYFPSNSYSTNQDARGNCFFTGLGNPHLDSAKIKFNVKLPNQTIVNFRLLAFGSCGDAPSFSSNTFEKETLSKELYSQMNADVEHKDYLSAMEKCKSILSLHEDGIVAVNSLRRIFQLIHIVYKNESDRKPVISQLKSLLERHILNKSLSKEFSDELFFYIQKCRVICGEYKLALAGFKKMMEDTRESNKSMLAKWEYEGLKSYLASVDKGDFGITLTPYQINAMIQNDLKKITGTNNVDGANKDDKISFINPSEYKLMQNYPNPFNPVTNIQFDLPKDNFVSLKVYDVVGKEVANVVNDFMQAGRYSISFDGSKLSSGIYFYRIATSDFVQTRRMILVK
ncbi:MAG: T9SS type A sorting domain-containing protein [Bacteroidetes bacterium]|nr:T9SS type A sorting domain-containing protein [Bacteroidota bacterium]